MRFRNVITGHILSTDNEGCVHMMQSSPAYEEVVDTSVVNSVPDTPVEDTSKPAAPKATKPKTTKAKASK